MDIGVSDLSAALTSQVKLRQDLADSESAIADNREKQLIGSEKQAALDEISRRAAEQEAAITNETLDARNKITQQLEEDRANRAMGKIGMAPSEIRALERTRDELGASDAQRIASIGKIATLERIAAQNKFEAKEKELALEAQLVQMRSQGAIEPDIKAAKLQGELAIIQDQLNQMLPLEVKAKLKVEAADLQNQLRALQFQQVMNPGQILQQRIEAQNRQALQNAVLPAGFTPRYLGEAPYRDISGRIVPSPTTADTIFRNPPMQPAEKQPLTKDEFQSALDAVMSKYWQ
jgi:hypothetical protein